MDIVAKKNSSNSFKEYFYLNNSICMQPGGDTFISLFQKKIYNHEKNKFSQDYGVYLNQKTTHPDYTEPLKYDLKMHSIGAYLDYENRWTDFKMKEMINLMRMALG